MVKLDALSAALTYLKVHIVADECHSVHPKITLIKSVPSGCKSSLRKGKWKLAKARLQKLSLKNLSLHEVSFLLNCQLIWTHFNETCIDTERNESASASRLDQSMICLTRSLLYKNW